MASSAMTNDIKLFGLNPSGETVGWNKKNCFEARDTLFACVDAQDNKNKFRCPDELYAYEMWCPNDFRRIASATKLRRDFDD